MSSRKLKVFLCHSSGDKPAVRDLYKRLQTDDFEPWLDEEDLLPGQDWEQEIPKAVRFSDAILVCLSRSSITKEGYVQKEIAVALDVAAEKPEGVIFLIPLKLEPCEMPERLKRWQAGMLYEERGYEKLLRSLNVRAGASGITICSPPVPIPLPTRPVVEGTIARPTGQTIQLPLIRDNIGMDFVLIHAGEFLMGADETNARDDERPAHRVRITKPFYLGKYPVTQAQWEKVMGNNPSRFKGDLKRPVENVSWNDVQVFLQQLPERNGNSYRLPTEAEWEYAARAGSVGAYCFGDDPQLLRKYAWYAENSKDTTHPVGELNANKWNLYDMHGNVWEWVQDLYTLDYYQQSPVDDPLGPKEGAFRVFRGGAFVRPYGDARCAFRNRSAPDNTSCSVGFRVVVLPKL